MKNIIILISLFLSTGVFANLQKASKLFDQKKFTEKDQVKIIRNLYKKKLYFSAAHFLRRYLITGGEYNEDLDSILEKLVLQTGTLAFIDLPYEVLDKNNYKALAFISALKLFDQGRYQKSIKYLKKIEKKNRFAPEALMMKGSAHALKNQFREALSSYKKCSEEASSFEDNAKDKRLKRYYTILKETCTIHVARLEYKQGNFEKSQVAYKAIPTRSYRWPYIILEQAWAAYANEDYNRSLGLLVTYKSPLLKSYFMPEGAVLRALNYFRLCLWDDSMQVINEYYNTYKSKSDALRKLIVPKKKSNSYFIELVNQDLSKNDKLNPFIRNLATQAKKTIKYNIELANYKGLKRERKRLKKYYKQKKSKLILYLHQRLGKEKRWRSRKLNHFIKKQMFSFLNEMHEYSYEMVNIKLEILFRKRDLLYKDIEIDQSRKRGSLANVKRKSNQHFYTFRGAFWADELGDYSFGLKSQCDAEK